MKYLLGIVVLLVTPGFVSAQMMSEHVEEDPNNRNGVIPTMDGDTLSGGSRISSGFDSLDDERVRLEIFVWHNSAWESIGSRWTKSMTN